ncbi:MAG TPA: hypothetical protein PK677_05535 [Acidiphilium sp.]|nr:MAG: hypothetical protein B7Z57_03555 [Acidiphilium sp. 37-60-79]HQT87999.1 hypothetical protein [Acidiphilium sp.]HQU23085.1 hypothetical protein [Acidiphilium sp.]
MSHLQAITNSEPAQNPDAGFIDIAARARKKYRLWASIANIRVADDEAERELEAIGAPVEKVADELAETLAKTDFATVEGAKALAQTIAIFGDIKARDVTDAAYIHERLIARLLTGLGAFE